jgi:hypothetical protein
MTQKEAHLIKSATDGDLGEERVRVRVRVAV